MQKLYVFALFSFSLFAFAQNSAPVFDGVVQLEEWATAQKFTIPYEIEPGDSSPAPQNTQVFITYTATDLYVGFIAQADMANLRSSIRNRDEGGNDDNVFIGFDAYGDGRYMIALGANPEGNQNDFKVFPNGDDDDYDVSFETLASKHPDSYHVEFKIPFANLQFKPAEVMRWKMVFSRSTYTNNTQSLSINFPLDRNNPCIVCQTPDEIILEGVKAVNRVNLLPYVFSGLSGEAVNGSLDFGKPMGNAGLSGLLDINNQTSLEFALNPDFSQVEADVSQVNANTTFALFFRERRPYFNEGNEIIDTQLNTVYTRSINDPLASTKMIHQGDQQRVYWLTAYDQASPYLIGGENESYGGEGGEAFANILSYQRTFDRGAYIGVISTNRLFKGGGNGHVVGVNGLLRLGDLYTLNFELNKSTTQEPISDWIDSEDVINATTVALDGEKKQGDALLFAIQRNTRNWNTQFNYQQYSPLYEAPLGFVTQTSIRNMELEQRYTHYPSKKEGLIQLLRFNVGSEMTFNYNQIRKYFDVYSNTYIQWKGNIESRINFGHVINEEFAGFFGRNLTEFSVFSSYNPSEKVRLGVYVAFNEAIRYDEDDPEVGRSFFIGSFDRFQLTPKLQISPSIRYSQLRSKLTDELFFKGYIARLNINYQFNKDLSFRLIGEYNDFDQGLFIQPLFKWNPNPFTIFYVGGTNGYSRMESQRNLAIDNSQLYLKFQYLFDL